MARKIAQGNVLAFVVVGVLLTALLVGGLVYLRHRAPAPVTVAGPTKTTTTTTTSTTGTTDMTQTTTTTTDNDLKKALESQTQTTSGTSATSTSTTSTASTNTAATANLPVTGPEDALWTALAASLLAGTGVAFIRSRRLI